MECGCPQDAVDVRGTIAVVQILCVPSIRQCHLDTASLSPRDVISNLSDSRRNRNPYQALSTRPNLGSLSVEVLGGVVLEDLSESFAHQTIAHDLQLSIIGLESPHQSTHLCGTFEWLVAM